MFVLARFAAGGCIVTSAASDLHPLDFHPELFDLGSVGLVAILKDATCIIHELL